MGASLVGRFASQGNGEGEGGTWAPSGSWACEEKR